MSSRNPATQARKINHLPAPIPRSLFKLGMGRRLTPDKRAAVIEARQANPDATQLEIARQAGVSRSSVRRIEGIVIGRAAVG
jgi:Sigma-70, region 4